MPGSIDYVGLLTELGSATFTDLRPAQVAALERYVAEHSPDFRRSQAHECLIGRVRTGQDGAGRAGTRNPVGTRLRACRWI